MNFVLGDIFDQKLFQKGPQKGHKQGSKSSPNFDIELRTSRTLLPGPKVELNELEHPKKVELRTRTQVRSTTNLATSTLIFILLDGMQHILK